MKKVLLFNYWLDKGYKRIYSPNVQIESQEVFKKTIGLFPDSDNIEIDENFKAVWVFQCENSETIYLGWIHSTGILPGQNYSLLSYQGIILEGNISINTIIEKLKRGPKKLYGGKSSTTDFEITENEEYFSDDENQFPINEGFINLLKSQKSSGKLMRAWSENPTNFIAEKIKSNNPYGTLEEKKDFVEVAKATRFVEVKKQKQIKGWLKTIIISTILAILAWLIWICFPTNDKSQPPKIKTVVTTNIIEIVTTNTIENLKPNTVENVTTNKPEQKTSETKK